MRSAHENVFEHDCCTADTEARLREMGRCRDAVIAEATVHETRLPLDRLIRGVVKSRVYGTRLATRG